MSRVYVVSVKIGNAHGLWQYKLSGTHDRIILHGLRHILNGACQLLGFDDADRSVVYLFSFSAEPFPGYQLCLEKLREVQGRGAGCYYGVKQSTIGDFTARGLFPSVVNTRYLLAWPENIFCKLEKSMTGGIVS